MQGKSKVFIYNKHPEKALNHFEWLACGKTLFWFGFTCIHAWILAEAGCGHRSVLHWSCGFLHWARILVSMTIMLISGSVKPIRCAASRGALGGVLCCFSRLHSCLSLVPVLCQLSLYKRNWIPPAAGPVRRSPLGQEELSPAWVQEEAQPQPPCGCPGALPATSILQSALVLCPLGTLRPKQYCTTDMFDGLWWQVLDWLFLYHAHKQQVKYGELKLWTDFLPVAWW